MKRFWEIALGILTAIGGFVEMGELVGMSLVGARFEFSLVWVVPVAVGGIIVFSEMAGRVAAVSQRPVFDCVRERMGPTVGLWNLVASFLVTALTAAAEIAGVALALELATSVHYVLWLPVVAFLVWLVIWRVNFKVMENTAALLGLTLIAAAVAVWKFGPDWSLVIDQALHPSIPPGEGPATYWYYAIAVLGAAFMPYEVFFFSSGAVEEGWTRRDLNVEKANSIVGFIFGGALALAFMLGSALTLAPEGIEVSHLSQVALPTVKVLGRLGLAALLIGFFAATFGAALETSLSCGYSVAQFFGWPWGKFLSPREDARFHLVTLLTVIAALVLMLTTIDPVQLTEYLIVLSAVALPLTYFPVLIVANDPDYMGDKVNKKWVNLIATIYFLIILAASLGGIPLMIITKAGG